MSKTLLRIAGGLEIFVSMIGAGISFLLLLFGGGIFLTALPFFLPLVTAIVFLYVASLNEAGMKEKRSIILIFSILAICTGNFAVGALGIAAYISLADRLQNGKEKVVDKRMRKLSLLLTLGVLLIIVAGAIFATSTWEILDGFVKTCILLVVSLLFFGISSLAEHKLKLTKSAVTYYLLGSFFAVAAYLAVGFFEIFGTWFSLEGAGQELFKASFCLFTTIVAGMAYRKYRKTEILYLVEFFVTVAIVYLLTFANLSTAWILLIVLLFFGGFVLANQKEKLPTLTVFSKGAFAVAVMALWVFMMNTAGTKIELIVTAVSVIWAAALLYAVALNRKESLFRVFAPMASIALLTGLLLFSGANGLAFLIKFAIAVLIIFAIAFIKKEDKLLFNVTLGVTDIAFTYLVLDAIRLDFGYFAVIAATVFLLLSFLTVMAGKLSEYHFERFLEPFKIILLTYAIYKVLMTFSFAEEGLFCGIIALIFAAVQLMKKGLPRSIYFWLAFGFATLTGLLNVMQSNAVLMPAFVAGIFGLLFLSAHRNKELQWFESILCALFNVSLFVFVYNFTRDMLGVIFYMAALALFYIVLGAAFQKNRMLCNVSFCTALFPIYTIACILKLSSEAMTAIEALIVLLFIVSYTRGILRGASWKFVNIAEVIVIGFWFLALIFNADLVQGIIIGIVAIVFVLIGYKSDKMWSYYYTGIVATILNLWQQLKSVWSKIPFWAYLLFAGLLLVGFVTYQEYSSGHKKTDEEKEQVVKNETETALTISSEQVISGTIIYLLIFVSVAKIVF